MWGISFLNPAFLFGILAAGLPLLIHFLIKRKVVKIPFSFFKLLESVSQKKLQRFKLSNILLLLIRIMIIFVLSIALSKPFFRNYSGIFFSQGEGSSLVILIDNSYSMSMVDTNISRLERAKNTAKSIINLMSEHDETVIIPFSNTTTSSAYNFTSNKIELFNDIDKIKISNYTTNVSSGLKQAKRPLKKAHNSVKRIILLTDLQKSGWQSIEHGIVSPEIKLNIINVGQKDAPNLAVTKLEFHKEAIIGQITSFNAIAKNFGKESMQNKLLSLVINGQKVFNQQVSLKPHEEIKLTLYHTFAKPGIHSGYIEISDDLMSIDNRYYFILDVIDKINILSVSGKNGPTPDKNETFYLNIALNPENSSNSIFRVKEITQDELDKIEFSDFDIYMFGNISSLSQIQIKVLEECVKRGGGIFFALGDKVLPDKYNQEIYRNGLSLLPGKITYQVVAPSVRHNQEGQYFYIDNIDFKNPVFSVFNEDIITNLNKVPFYSFYRTEVDELTKNIYILARFNDGAPALIEKIYGNGRILLFTSSIGLDWNSLAISNVFPTFIHQIARYLALRNKNVKTNFKIGDSDIPNKLTSQSPGIYKFDNNMYSLNLDFKESDLEMIEEEDIFKKINSSSIQLSSNLSLNSLHKSSIDNWFRGEIWKVLFLILLFLVVLETLVANRNKN